MLKSSKSSRIDGELRESEHYCYICVKKHDADRVCTDNWQQVQEQVLREQAEEYSYLYGDDEDEHPEGW